MRAIKTSLVILFLLLTVYPVNAQDFDFEDNFSKGNAALDSGQYELAIKYLEPCEKFASQDTTKDMQKIDNFLLNKIADSHAKLGNYKKAIELGTQALEVCKRVLGESHPRYANSLDNLANYYYYLGDNTKAIEYGTQAMEICKQVFGESSSDYAISLDNLANYYYYLGDNTKAIEYETQAMEICKQVFGETSPDYAISLDNLANYYYYLGDNTKAIEYGTQAMEICKQVFGESSPDYATSLNNLALYYYYSGDYFKAVELGTQAMEIRKQVLGETHPDYATSLSNLALYYSKLDDYTKAVELGKQAIEIQKRILEESHPAYATSLSNLALYYSNLGDYTKAVELGTKALEIRKGVFGESHSSYATSLNNLAGYYFKLGDYNKAVELGAQALEIFKRVFGESHSTYTTSLSNLAGYYSGLGDYSKAVELGTQALEIRKRVLGESHPDYATSLSNLAGYYSDLGDYSKAVELGTQAMEIQKQVLGESHLDYATSLNNLAQYYSHLGDYSKTVELGTQVLDIRKQVLGEFHSDYATSLSNLADYYSDLGDYSKAVELGTQALEIRKQVLCESHPDYVTSLSNLATYNYFGGNYGDAYQLFLNCVLHTKDIVLSQFKGLTNRTRETFWNKSKNEFTYLPSFCLKAGGHVGVGEVYDNSALFTKGLLLNAETSLRDLILESGDSAAVKQFDAMQMIRTTLNKQYEKPIAERRLNCDSLERVAEQMERELMKSSKAFGDFTRNLTVGWKDVQKGLGDDDVAIEFLASPVFGGDSILYVALTLKKGYDKPKMITLFEERELRMVRESKWYTTPALCELVWGPLADELKGVKNVYFSPSGALYNIGIEQLPCSATENIGERYNMFRLSSTRELALRHDMPSEKSSALYGGLRYYVPPTELLAYNRAKGYSRSSSSRDVFERLPETKTEIDNITALLRAHSYGEPAIYEGDEGTEESFKALSGKRTSIIHLATHGSYITPTAAEKQRKRDMMNRLTFLRAGDDRQSSEEDEALTRSFLVMSGGKMLWTSDSIPEGVDDGLLTAQEISRIDLRGCDLAVLSACETGLGDISSEGVMGLQRGFKKAGVQSIVMSLWKVADRPTQEYMTEFYRHLTAGEGKRTSFLAAQRFLKEKYPTNLPQDESRPPYWASFILLDPEVQ